MSGIGHFAAGFAAKSNLPTIPLWVLLIASEANDLLYALLSATGIEPKGGIASMDFQQGVRYLLPASNPWSHGLLMSTIWAITAAAIAYLVYRDRKISAILGLVVFSHWVLDFLMHSNLPLAFSGSPLVGLGLENSGAGFLFMTTLDLVILTGGIILYFRARKQAKAFTAEA